MKLLDMPEFKASDLIARDIEAMAEMSKAIKSTFPIGYIWISFDERNPNQFIGGTWKKIEGRFLWAAGSAETGETFDQMHQVEGTVAHRHLTAVGFDGERMFGFMDSNGLPFYGSEVADRRKGINVQKSYDIQDERVRINYTAHERNMPPFIVCSMWERVG